MKTLAFAALSCTALWFMETPLLAKVRFLSALLALGTTWLLLRQWPALAAVPVALAVSGMHARHQRHQAALVERGVGAHMIVGYQSADELRELLSRVHIGGVFVTARNAKGKTAAALADEIASFKALQPGLLVTTDQEGGAVSRLSGPLPLRALNDLAIPSDLRSVGINVTFGPVVDLRMTRSMLDAHSQIYERAISSDPEEVARVAAAYARASLDAGVMPVAKHFPGLGRVAEDTHLRSAHLSEDPDLLAATDWIPYTQLPAGSAVMVGHVTLDRVDPHQPASLSYAVVSEVLKGRLGFKGTVITDDLCMAPTYFADGGPVKSFEKALAAGVDYVLVSYDIAVVEQILAEATVKISER